MSTVELKEKVHKALDEVKDDYILEGVLSLIEFEKDNNIVIEVTEEQKNAINEARQQIKDGHCSTNEEFDKEIDEWLNA